MSEIICGDCLEVMPTLSDKSIDLIILDPPYNKNIRDWDNVDEYIEWMGTVLKECERLLKNRGSLYLFHNVPETFFELGMWIKNNTPFVFKQFIVWNKKFKGCKKEGFLQGIIEGRGSRNYLQMAEYILFYTVQDETGLTPVYSDRMNFMSIREYMQQELKKSGLTKGDINRVLGSATSGGGMACHYFGDTDQWSLPTQEKYIKLQSTGVFQKPYDELSQEYEDLRREYEDLRYRFNNQRTHHSIWNYSIVKKTWHYTPKPLKLIKNIILHSSNEGDMVLDPFLGSGTTALACKQLNRRCIGIEINPEYVEMAKTRKVQSLHQRRGIIHDYK